MVALPPTTGRELQLRAVRLVHTTAWAAIEGCMFLVLVRGVQGRSDRSVALAAGVVGAETIVYAGNGFRCPLTDLAEELGAGSGSVTDIYLPGWLARNLPAIHAPLIIAAAALHSRNIFGDRPISEKQST